MINPVIGIIGGKGKMGQLFASFFLSRGVKVLISDLGTKLSNEDLAKKSDIIIVSVPISVTEKVIKNILPHLQKKSALVDLTSIKVKPLKAMLKANCEVMGLHPMFANSNPIPRQTIIYCKTKKSGERCKWLLKFFKENEVILEGMTAKEHDKLMSVIQGLVHFADITFVDSLRKSKIPIEKIIKYSSKASELKIALAARILHQDPELYSSIQIENKENLKLEKKYLKSFQKLQEIIIKKDSRKFLKYFKKNKEYFKRYTDKAFQTSTELIDKLIEIKSEKIIFKSKTAKKDELACLGPKLTYSDQAADQYLKGIPDKSKFYASNISEVFSLVEEGKVKEGLVPYENLLNGTVRETFDNLFKKNVHFSKKVSLKIEHQLLGLNHSSAKNIKKIISHPQAIAQCLNYLQKNYPKAKLIEAPSTTAGVTEILKSNDSSSAIIASPKIAGHYHLKTLAQNISNLKNNFTHFINLKKGAYQQKESTKIISIVFNFKANKPASLSTVLNVFAVEKINLTKIESRPFTKNFGEYIFFLEFEADILNKKVEKLLKKIESKVRNLKIIGAV